MKNFRYFFVLLFLFAFGCTNYLQKADNAYLKQDWDNAAINYSKALEKTSESTEISYIKPRLKESQENASMQHLKKAKEYLAINDSSSAYKHAELAFNFNPTPEVQQILSELRVTEGQRYLEEGQNAFKNEHWQEAVSLLTNAQKISPTDEGNSLLNQAKTKLKEHQNKEFDDAITQAQNNLNSRRWMDAIAQYEKAHKISSTTQTKREYQFCKLMFEAEKKSLSGSPNELNHAVSIYREALTFNIDSDYVQTKLDEIQPANYRIIFNSALILPFKPNTKTAWDGLGNSVENAEALLGELGAFAGPKGAAASQLAVLAMKIANIGFAAPDCYIEITFNNQVYGGVGTKKQDDYQPVWNFPLPFSGFSKSDSGVLSVNVIDADERNDDNIGSFQIKLSDLLAEEGPRTLKFFDSQGYLKAGGLLLLNVSVERF